MSFAQPAALSREQIAAFEAEVIAIRDEEMRKIGQKDVDYIRKIIRICRASEVAGRGLLHFGVGPLSWIAGVLALAGAKILDNMEIGHNVMHGQYDWTGDPALNSQTFEWDIACDGEQWRHSHNVRHHSHTNILGKDKDLGYAVLRLTDEQRWKPRHRYQPLVNLLLALNFQHAVGSHDVEFAKYKYKKISKAEYKGQLQRFLGKAGRQALKDYVIFPALALWSAPRVLAGNFAANLLRNIWTYVVIFCGHFTEGVAIYREEDTRNETRGDWYIRQLSGSSNLEGGRLFHILCGHLSHQIEHHMFPDMPAHHYPLIAPKIQALCRKYGLRYNTGSLFAQFKTVLQRIHRHARQPAAMAASV